MRSLRKSLVLLLLILGLLAAACGGDDGDSSADASGGGSSSSAPVDVRLGYFPNITHAPGIIGVLGGYFEDALPEGDTLKTTTFNAGPEAVQALLTDSLDLTFIGPNPAINAFAQSKGSAIRIVSGTTSGGAFLVVKDGIDSASDLKGKAIATPQLGNTQDVALRAWLKDEGLSADEAGGGDVSIKPQANGDALAAFVGGSIDGAWVPEPWASRFIQEGKGHVLVDEADLWPEGKYVTTHLIVRTKFLTEHPDAVKAILEGLADAIDLTQTDPAKAKELANQGIEAVTGKPLSQAVLDASWENLTFTLDPIASSLKTSAEDAEAVGLLDPVDLKGIYDLDLLNEVLADRGEPAVKGF
jgi:NitT/TauT family transport system substrate-binding protein